MKEPKYICPTCGAIIGYVGWAFTALRLPMLKHVCKTTEERGALGGRWRGEALKLVNEWDRVVERDQTTGPYEYGLGAIELLRQMLQNPDAGPVLPQIDGDRLPPIRSKVFIRLASLDAWVEHAVVGYYVWPDLGGDPHLHRVFVRVIDAKGYENSRMLSDVRIHQTEDVREAIAAIDKLTGAEVTTQ